MLFVALNFKKVTFAQLHTTQNVEAEIFSNEFEGCGVEFILFKIMRGCSWILAGIIFLLFLICATSEKYARSSNLDAISFLCSKNFYIDSKFNKYILMEKYAIINNTIIDRIWIILFDHWSLFD